MKKLRKKIITGHLVLLILLSMGTIISAEELNPPIADFTWTAEDLKVNFTDASTDNGSILSWLWDFGDGNTSNLSNVSHTYEFEGNYTVNLTVTDDEGLTNSSIKIITVSIAVTPPSTGSLSCEVRITPRTLNSKSRGQWITCNIELLDGANASEINISSLRINGDVKADESTAKIGDFDDDNKSQLKVKFKRSDVIEVVGLENISDIIVSGKLNDGTSFSSSDTIKTKHQAQIRKGKQLGSLLRSLMKNNPKFEELINELLDMLD